MLLTPGPVFQTMDGARLALIQSEGVKTALLTDKPPPFTLTSRQLSSPLSSQSFNCCMDVSFVRAFFVSGLFLPRESMLNRYLAEIGRGKNRILNNRHTYTSLPLVL